ncbi:MAG: SLATT domain-containing protein [Proteobacteria bacterium]|nr:SLATT domain-containing protein [Pseudomonadota bacterium]
MELSDNIWWTRKARIQAEKRLLSSDFQAQTLLLWYSFCSVSAAIYYLKFNTQSEYAGISWVVFSVLILCISGFINGLSYKERAALVKDSYETLHALYHRACKNKEDTNEIAKEYEQILSVCENHSDIDHYLSILNTNLTSNDPNDVNKKPTFYIWAFISFYFIKRWLILSGLYLLPVIIFFIMEFASDCKGTI